MKASTIIQLAIAGAIGYGLYRLYGLIEDKLKGAADSTAETIASAWLKLFPLPPAMQVLGNVKFPGNISVPLKSLQIREDANHNVFTQYAGYLWKLQPSDANGNWPAVRVM